MSVILKAVIVQALKHLRGPAVDISSTLPGVSLRTVSILKSPIRQNIEFRSRIFFFFRSNIRCHISTVRRYSYDVIQNAWITFSRFDRRYFTWDRRYCFEIRLRIWKHVRVCGSIKEPSSHNIDVVFSIARKLQTDNLITDFIADCDIMISFWNIYMSMYWNFTVEHIFIIQKIHVVSFVWIILPKTCKIHYIVEIWKKISKK